MTALTALPDIVQMAGLGDSLVDGSYLAHATAEGGGGSWMERIADEVAAYLGRPLLSTGNIGQLSQPNRWSRSAGFTFIYSSAVLAASAGDNTGTLTTLNIQRADAMSVGASGSVVLWNGTSSCTIAFTGKTGKTQLTGCSKSSGTSFVLTAGDMVMQAAIGTPGTFVAMAPFGGGYCALTGGSTVIETFTRSSYWPPVVGVQVTFCDMSIGTTMWRYRIDAGSWVTPTITLAKNDGLRSFYIPTAMTSTIEFQAYDGSSAVPMWVTHVQACYIDPRTAGLKGVIVHNYGINGWTANDATCAMRAAVGGDRLAILDSVTPDATSGAITCTPNAGVWEMFQTNELAFADTTSFAAQLATINTRCAPLGPVAFISPHETGGGTGTTQATYRTQTETSAATASASYYNLFDRLQDTGYGGVAAQASTLGNANYLGDFVHYAQPGHDDWGKRSGGWIITNFLSAVTQPVTNTFYVGASGVGGTDLLGGLPSTESVGNAAGTGTAYGAAANVGAAAGNAAGTGTAYGTSTSEASPAGNAAGTGAAYQPAVTVAPNVGNAAGTGAAYGAGVNFGPSPAQAIGTGDAYNPSISLAPNTGIAAGTGTAGAATPSVAVNAQAAAGTGAAYAPGGTGTATSGLAAGTGTAYDAAVSLATSAEDAAGTGAAGGTSSAVETGPTVAAGTGTAWDATVTTSTSSATNAPADVAAGTGTAYGPAVSIAPNSGIASGAGTAYAPSISITVGAEGAAGTGTAGQPGGTDVSNPQAATGTGTAYQAHVDIITPTSGANTAAGTGTAYQPHITISVAAGLASGTGGGYGPVFPGQATTATGTGTAYNATVTLGGPPAHATVSGVPSWTATVTASGRLTATVTG